MRRRFVYFAHVRTRKFSHPAHKKRIALSELIRPLFSFTEQHVCKLHPHSPELLFAHSNYAPKLGLCHLIHSHYHDFGDPLAFPLGLLAGRIFCWFRYVSEHPLSKKRHADIQASSHILQTSLIPWLFHVVPPWGWHICFLLTYLEDGLLCKFATDIYGPKRLLAIILIHWPFIWHHNQVKFVQC